MPPLTTGRVVCGAAAAALALAIGGTLVWRMRRRRIMSRNESADRLSSEFTLTSIPGLFGAIGLDIGGTLTKMAYLHPLTAPPSPVLAAQFYGETGERMSELQFPCAPLGGDIHFVRCATHGLEHAGALLRPVDRPTGRVLRATGGGAYKSAESLGSKLGISFDKVDEMESIVLGFRFLRRFGPGDEVYSLSLPPGQPHAVPKIVVQRWPPPSHPLIIVNIGSGVSMLRVVDRFFERIGGTALGGATFLGLCRLTTSAQTFDEALALCRRGDNTAVDKLVGDIYGKGGYEKLRLMADMVASCFGKLTAVADPAKECREEDVALGLLRMITIQVALLATAIARQHGALDGLYFVGGFLTEHNDMARSLLAYFCMQIGCTAKFLRHSDFVGALGSLAEDLAGEVSPPLGSSFVTTVADPASSLSPTIAPPDLTPTF
jgi:pantothenate kinase